MNCGGIGNKMQYKLIGFKCLIITDCLVKKLIARNEILIYFLLLQLIN